MKKGMIKRGAERDKEISKEESTGISSMSGMNKPAKKLTKTQLDEALIENFVGLQRVLTNLSIKFDSLSDNISKLLQLFEISARSFMEKQGVKSTQDVERDKEFLNKLNTLIDQNKTLARGLTFMGEKVRERIQSQSAEPEQFSPQERRMPSIEQRFEREDMKPKPRPLPII